MNAQPASTPRHGWQRAWTEPRHFFFWLGLLSLLALISLLTAATLGPDQPNNLLSWAILAAVLGFLIGTLGLILACFAPARRRLERQLRYKLLWLAGIVTLVALFYAIENWRGRTAWMEFKNAWQAQGVYFDADKILPPEIPASSNMFEAAPWTDLHWHRPSDGSGVVFQNTNNSSESWFSIAAPGSGRMPNDTDILTARRVNLEDWQAYYRSATNSSAAANEPATNFFPVATTAQTPARDVLLALTRYESRLAELRSAALRPDARFWINYEDGFNALLPHLAKMKGIAQYLHLRAIALLADGQSDAAFQDVRLAIRLSEAIRNEPTLISQLVEAAMIQINLGTIWEGLADHRWNEAQLAQLEQQLAPLDSLASYHRGMDGERYGAVWLMEYLKRTDNLYILMDPGQTEAASFAHDFERALGKTLFQITPSGWYDQNKLSLGQMHVEFIRPLVDLQQRTVSPKAASRTSEVIDRKAQHWSPYNMYGEMLLPALSKSARKFASVQCYLDLARVSIALERNHLATGAYPASLAALAPEYLAHLPHDVITGQPLQYRRTDAGSFLLYSVGWNENDDGGKVVMRLTKDGKPGAAVNQDEGDWVWPDPAK